MIFSPYGDELSKRPCAQSINPFVAELLPSGIADQRVGWEVAHSAVVEEMKTAVNGRTIRHTPSELMLMTNQHDHIDGREGDRIRTLALVEGIGREQSAGRGTERRNRLVDVVVPDDEKDRLEVAGARSTEPLELFLR